MRVRGALVVLAALTLAACATQRLPPPVGAGSLESLPGWSEEDHAAAFQVVRSACADMRPEDRPRACAATLAHAYLGEGAARAFLDRRFRELPVAGQGLLTGYFSPSYPARRRPDAEFTAPLRPPPRDPLKAPSRAAIEQQPAPHALAWMRPEDLFFMQVQGTGELVFEDGERARAVFAATNGAPFVAIARPMVAEGLIEAGRADAASLHAWLAEHRGPEADAVMDKDPRYVFFRLAPDDGREPAGASGAALIPGRSLAVDPAFHGYFELLWIDAGPYRRLTVALDRGGAIKGPARADLYTGRGSRAGEEAATLRQPLWLYRVVPAEGG